ncbi:MAG: HYR domain-containing protein, partial [Saprospiraceae bacterium]
MNPVAIPLSTHTSRFRTLSAKGWSLLVLLSGLFLFAQDASGQCSVNADPNSAMNPLQDTLLLYGDTLVLNQSAVLGTINSISDAGTCTSCALEFYDEATSTWQDSLLLDCNSSDTFLIRANSSNDSGCESDTVFLEITVIDVADPIIVNCPSDITVSITSDSCYYDMLLPRPDTVTDNCELDSMFVAFTGTSPSGSVTVPADFGIQSMAKIVNFLDTVAPFDTLFSFFASPDSCAGVTNVAYTFFDRTGNIATCDFNVIVQGIYKPVWDDPRMSRLGAGYNLLDSISSELDTTVYTSGWATGGDSSRSLTIYLDCTSPTYDADTAWLAQFAPTALDSCGTNVVVVGDSSEWTGYVDEMCTTYDATNNVKFTNFTRYWTVKETCGTTYASNDTFRLIVRTVDQTPPYLHHDTAGVKVPSMVLMDVFGSHTGIDSTSEWYGDTIRFYSSGEYGTNPNWCGVTIGNDTLSILGVDCHDSLEYSWKIDSSFDFRGDPIMWTVDSAGGNDIADSIMTWPVGWHYFKYYVEDSCGNISFFHVTMNIIDDTPPSFATCPEDTVLAADVGCQKLHIWDIPTVEDSCLLDTVYVQTIDPAGQINAVTVTDTLPTGKAFAVFPVGPTTVHYIAIDTFGNSDTCTFIVTVNDSLDPVARAMALTRGLDNNGEVIVQADEFDDNSSDNCTADENLIFKVALDTGMLVFVDSLEFNCSDAGNTYDVQLLVSDTFGNTDTVATTITINDDTPPVVVCQRDTAYLSASGSASIAPANVDGGSTDNCGIDSMWVDIDEFFCTDIGENTVVFSVRDGSGNLATCNAVVEVLDTTSPTANCRSAHSIYLDDMGQGTLTASDIDNASSDNCTVDNLSIDVTEFDCANVGTPQTVTLTVTDQDGNTSTCTSQVTAQDTVAPEVICDEVILSLTSTDSVITPAFVEDQSDDNCTAVTLSVDRDSFSCEDLGQTIMVTLYAQDDHGNIDSCVAEVTVTEDVQPTAVCRTDTLTVTLNAIGNGSVSVGDIDNGSFDLCGAPDSMFVTPSAFGCDDLGLNTVVLYVQDDEGNSDFCQATVNVVDPSVPFVTCDPHTAYVDSSGSVTVDAFEFEKAAGGVGPCGPIVQRLFRVVGHPTADVFATQHTFTCDDDLGLHVVVYKIVTSDGKEDSCNTTLTIEDVIEPIAVCADITIDLSGDLGAGMVSLVPGQVNDESWDNCEFDLALSKADLNSFSDSLFYNCMDE